MSWATVAYRAAVLALLCAIWWQVGGGEWAQRMYWRAYFSRPATHAEEPKPGGRDPLEFGADQALKELQDRAKAEAASTPHR